MSLADLNKMAEDRFQKIKDKHFDKPLIQEAIKAQDRFNFVDNKEELSREDFERPVSQFVKEMKERGLHPIPVPIPSKETHYELQSIKVDEQASMLDAILTFTDSLDVSNNIKLAICNLISLSSKQGAEFNEVLLKSYTLIGDEKRKLGDKQ